MSGQSLMQPGMQSLMQPVSMGMQSAPCPTMWDTIASYKWIIIAIIALFVYMRYFNKKPKEEEKK